MRLHIDLRSGDEATYIDLRSGDETTYRLDALWAIHTMCSSLIPRPSIQYTHTVLRVWEQD